MSERSEHVRDTAYGRRPPLSTVDRFGTWLSARAIRRRTGSLAGKRLGDFGCGYDARFVRTVLDELASAVLVDVALAPDLVSNPRGRGDRVAFPSRSSRSRTTPSSCISVLEHLAAPLEAASLPSDSSPGGVGPQRPQLAW